MAGRETTKSQPSERIEKTAGLKTSPASLRDLHRRRTQIWSTSLIAIIGLAAIIGLLWLGQDLLPDALKPEELSQWVVVVLLGGLMFSLLLYAAEKEQALRKLSELLLEERIRAESLASRLAEAARLSEVSKAINATLERDPVLDLILTSALELIGGDEASVMLLDEERSHLEVVSYRGSGPDEIKNARVQVGSGIAGVVAQTQEPLLIQGNRVPPSAEGGHPQRGINSSMSVPLVRGGELIGVLNLMDTTGTKTFDESDLMALGFFAENAAIALGNASIYERERQAVDRLEDLDRLKSDFIATVSHELRTPLTAIVGSAQILTRRFETMPLDQQRQFISAIDNQSQRLSRLVQDLLTTESVEAGVVRLRREPLDLEALCNECLEDIRATPVAGERKLVLDVRSEKVEAWGDSGALRQVITNLVENACKYSSDETTVTVGLEEHPGEAVISVRDEGRGIPQEKLAQIFDRFYQTDASNTRTAGGVGLGLFIVKNLVEGHGGSVRVESEEGQGTTFFVHLVKRREDPAGRGTSTR